jgi:hypothetical protein
MHWIHPVPRFFERKANKTICSLSHLNDDHENSRIVDSFYLSLFSNAGRKLDNILEYNKINNRLPQDIPHSKFVEAIWQLVDAP